MNMLNVIHISILFVIPVWNVFEKEIGKQVKKKKEKKKDKNRYDHAVPIYHVLIPNHDSLCDIMKNRLVGAWG